MEARTTGYATEYGTGDRLAMKEATIVTIYPTLYWVEKDFMGSSHIMVQHEGMHSFKYATFYYDYAYTSNAGVHDAVVSVMNGFGIEEKDIVWKSRDAI
jgi:hypothetical protein